MGIEIERKYLVADATWRESKVPGRKIVQAYLASTDILVFRVRILDDIEAYLTIKGGRTGISRPEFEYEIPLRDARQLVAMASDAIVEKTRYRISVGTHVWEVDEYAGANTGLITAEIELSEESEDFQRPAWLGIEVSGQPRYGNASLAVRPYADWSSQ